MGKEIYIGPRQVSPELTRASVKPKLESGDIFMAKSDGGSGDIPGQASEQNITRETTRGVSRLTSARRSLSARVRPPAVAHALLDNPEPPQNPFGDEFKVNVEVMRAWSDFLAEGKPEAAARESQITSLGYQEDVEKVYEAENKELTQEAQDVLRRFGAGELTLESLPEDFSRILEENGIDKELIEKYKDQPAIFRFSLLFSRNRSNIDHRLDAEARPADTDHEDQPPIAPPKEAEDLDDEEGEEDSSRRREDREDERDDEDILSGLSDEDRRMFGDELRDLAIQREGNRDLRALMQQMEIELSEAIQDPEVKSAMEERMSEKTGRPYKITDVASFMEAIFPVKALEERARRNQLARLRMERERGGEAIYVPKSLEELAILVMDRSTPEYQRGGDRQLLRYKKERVLMPNGSYEERETDTIESVNTINFMHWARDNYMLVHLNNPTTDVNFFSDIATNVRGQGFAGPISFYEITATESYFLKEERNADGVVVNRVEDEEYKALRTQMLLEVYTMQIIRNPAISYVLRDRAEREKMLGAIANANVLNPVTKFFSTIFGQPSMQARSIVDLLGRDEKGSIRGRELQARKESNFAMGTSTREILASFIRIMDYKSLRKIFDDPDCPLFTYEYDKWDQDSGKKSILQPGEEPPHTAPDAKGSVDRKREWYYTAEEVAYLATQGVTVKEGHVKLIKKLDGKPDLVSGPIVIKGEDIRRGAHIPTQDELRAQYPGSYFFIKTSAPDSKTGDVKITFGPQLDPVAGEPPEEFMRWLNIFLTPTPDQRQQDEVRQRFRLAVMQKNGISYREAQSAELMGYSIAHITGVGAAADIDAVGFDWWTRMLRFRDKRKREKSSSRNASYGSEFNMEGIKRIALTFLEGARDIRGRSLEKLILGGEGRDIHTSDKESPLKKKVDYQRDDEGRIKFVDTSGAPVTVEAWDYKLVNRTEYRVVRHPGSKIDVVEPRNVAEVIFLDRDGNVVDVGPNKPADIEVKDLDVPIDFESDLQKQFHPNHLLAGSKIYQWVFSQKGMNFAQMVDGEDSRANPIFKWGEINDVKHGLIHDVRYMVKTWGKINFAEKHVYTEKVEQRDERGRLVGTDAHGHEVELDESWYVMHNGKRGHERGDPKTYFENKEMTVLESMFDYDALYYIDQELRAAGFHKQIEGNPHTFTVKDPLGKRPDITIDYSAAANDPIGKGASNFSGAVWKGMFDYMVAAEIESHRSPGSGYDFQGYIDVRKTKEVLELSGMLDSYQVNIIWDRLGLSDTKLFSQYLATELASGGISGLFKALMAMAKGAIS